MKRLLALIAAIGAVALLWGVPAPSSRAAGGDPTVIATIPIAPGGHIPYDVAVNSTTNLIYTANLGSNNVSVIDGGTNTVVATVPVGSSPRGVAVNPNTNLIYVANSDSNNVSVIDGAGNTVIATVAVGSDPAGVAVNPSTNLIYVVNPGSGNVFVIDGAGNTVIATVAVGSDPAGVAVNPSTNLIYVVNSSSSVSVIDGGSNTVVATVVIRGFLEGVAVNPSTNLIYVTTLNGSVSVIDGADNTVVATVAVGIWLKGVAVNPSTNRIYGAGFWSSHVSVIDGGSNTVVATVVIGRYLEGVAVNPDTNRIYVTNSSDDTVSVIEDIPGPTPTPTDTATPCVVDGQPCTPTPVPPTHTPTPTNTPVPSVTLSIDMDPGNGTGPCNPVDATAMHNVGASYKVAVCLQNAPVSAAGFDVTLTYNSQLNECQPQPASCVINNRYTDCNPDANAGFSSFGTPQLIIGWDCSFGVPPNSFPSCTGGIAHIACMTTDNGVATLPYGNGVAAPLFEVAFSAIAGGVDNLSVTAGISLAWDRYASAFVDCDPLRAGGDCIPGTYANVTPTVEPTGTVTPMPTNTYTPTPTNTVSPTPTFTPTLTRTPPPHSGSVGGAILLPPPAIADGLSTPQGGSGPSLPTWPALAMGLGAITATLFAACYIGRRRSF